MADVGTVRCRRERRLGRITLDRPRRINALDLEMIRAIRAALDRWEGDDDVELVVLDGTGERGFCAGGDLTVVHASATGDGTDATVLWREEYELDLRMAEFGKPVVALMDGMVMGGGLGLTVNADLRVVTDRSTLAMPEVGIGLAPDVGASHFLRAGPGHVGTHLALTGDRLAGPEAIGAGLADVLVPRERLEAFVETLQTSAPDRAAGRHGDPATGTGPSPAAAWIDECYDATDPLEIVTRLGAHPDPAAQRAAGTIRGASPTAVWVARRALLEAERRPGLAACLERDFRMCVHFLRHPDLAAGTGAVVARSGAPRWAPARLEDVAPDEVEAFFAPLDGVAGPALGTPDAVRPGCR